MADKIQPVSKPVPHPGGMVDGASHKTLTTPSPSFGKYYGSGKEGKDAKGGSSMMGKK